MGQKYRALRVHEHEAGQFDRKIETLDVSQLPDNEVLVRVKYAGLNYKDALSAYGNKGVTRRYPHTPGIDAAGVVEESSSYLFKPGDKVIAGGYDLGMNTDGGFGEYISVPAEWLVPLPESISLRDSMVIGGKGFTAGLSVMSLTEQGVKPGDGPVLVTGAAGGVGSWSVLILKKLGYEVIAGTSNIADSQEMIRKLGADVHVDKSVIDDTSGKALLKWKWAGAIENVGGNVLSTALRACKPGGTVTCCGNIYSGELNMTVYPFILNAVRLIGISAQITPPETRTKVWEKFKDDYKVKMPDIVTEVSLEELPEALEKAIGKKNRGQVLLKHD
ncbi:MAG TPA: YhdH/YhfP family quinone oxidoreductase [Bacteroidales bacterium]|nr:YhdH/YhfP family quinone oxidoreductase [Bacteroidales bacterium]